MKPLTTIQAAAELGVTPNYITRLAVAGRIPRASKPGRDWVFEPPIEILPLARRRKEKRL